jgi:hypothetical protein
VNPSDVSGQWTRDRLTTAEGGEWKHGKATRGEILRERVNRGGRELAIGKWFLWLGKVLIFLLH